MRGQTSSWLEQSPERSLLSSSVKSFFDSLWLLKVFTQCPYRMWVLPPDSHDLALLIHPDCPEGGKREILPDRNIVAMHRGGGALGQVKQHSRWSLRTADQRDKTTPFYLHSPNSSSLSHPGGERGLMGRCSHGVTGGLGRGQRDPCVELCQDPLRKGWTNQEGRKKVQTSRLSQMTFLFHLPCPEKSRQPPRSKAFIYLPCQ